VLAEIQAAVRAGQVPGGAGGGGLPVLRAGDLFASVVTAHPGALLCDGATYNSNEYPALADALGITAATFAVPDYRGRTIVGRDAGQTEFDVMLEAGGSKTHTLTQAQLPPANHLVKWRDDDQGGGSQIGLTDFSNVSGGAAAGGSETVNITNGQSDPHNNLQPYRVANIFIVTGNP
jgi:microcystin-dependent protein